MRQRWNGLFVTGTDTGVGKTVVTAAIAAALRSEGPRVGVWKPVQSGALIGQGITDAERLLRGANIEERPDAVAPFTYEAPLAPHLAAMQAGVTLTLENLLEAGVPLANKYDALLIEGAGGIAVPLTEDALVIDLIALLGVPVLIVARSGLGTINHTLLTAAHLRQRGIPIVGVVLNESEASTRHHDPSAATNAECIRHYGGLEVLGRFPWLDDESCPEKLMEAVHRTLDLTPVKRALTYTNQI